MRRLITVSEAAKRKGVSRQAIHAAIRANKLEGVSEVVQKVIWKVTVTSLNGYEPNPNMKRPGRKAASNGEVK